MIDLSKYIKQAKEDEKCSICEEKIEKGKSCLDVEKLICEDCLYWLYRKIFESNVR